MTSALDDNSFLDLSVVQFKEYLRRLKSEAGNDTAHVSQIVQMYKRHRRSKRGAKSAKAGVNPSAVRTTQENALGSGGRMSEINEDEMLNLSLAKFKAKLKELKSTGLSRDDSKKLVQAFKAIRKERRVKTRKSIDISDSKKVDVEDCSEKLDSSMNLNMEVTTNLKRAKKLSTNRKSDQMEISANQNGDQKAPTNQHRDRKVPDNQNRLGSKTPASPNRDQTRSTNQNRPEWKTPTNQKQDPDKYNASRQSMPWGQSGVSGHPTPNSAGLVGMGNGDEVGERPRTKLGAQRRQQEKLHKICFNCRKPGHVVSDCPRAVDMESSGIICFKCGQADHTSRQCILSTKEYRFAKCFICSETGHLARDCSQNSNGIYPHGGECLLCGKKDHLKKHCPRKIDTDSAHDQQTSLATLSSVKSSIDEESNTDAADRNRNREPKPKIVRM